MNSRFTFNYIIFLALSFLIIFGFQYFFAPKQKENVTKQETVSEKAPVSEKRTAAPTSVSSKYEKLIENGAQGKIIKIDSPLYKAEIDTLGGRVTRWELKKYSQTTQDDSPPVNLINGKNQILSTVDIERQEVPFLVPYQFSGRSNIEVDDDNKGITLRYADESGLEIIKTIEFDAANYTLEESITLGNGSGAPQRFNVGFQTFGAVAEDGIRGTNNSELYVFVNNELKKVSKLPSQPEKMSGQVSWFGFGNKYFLAAIIPGTGSSSSVLASAVEKDDLINAQFSYPESKVNSGYSSTTKWRLYLGPKEANNLQSVGSSLEQAINYGWIEVLAKVALKFLKMINSIFHNYGISIIAITIILRVVFLPLTLKSMRSMKAMQVKMADLKPKIDAMKEKYKDDKTKQNAELMKLYTSHGVNPLSSLGGCFPLLLQIPVFIALYDVLLYSIELRQSSFLWIADLAEPEHLFDIPLFGEFAIPFRILPLAMGISWFISQKMTPTGVAPASESMELQMKMMQFLPIIFTVMFWGLPSGLILYWTVSNILSIGQQIYINKTVHVEKKGA